jgi:hypothetical protein
VSGKAARHGELQGKGGACVWFSLQAPDMLSRAKERWASLPLADRVVLSLAFEEAMSNPERVVDYKWKYCRLKSGQPITIHEFRVGFANFIVVTSEALAFIYDLWVDPGIAIAAEW